MGKCRQIPMMVVISAVIMAFFVGKTSSSSPSPSSSPAPPDCSTAFLNLIPCLNFVQPGSNLTTPGSDCCNGFKGLVANEPVCLCQLVANSSATSGFPVDRKRAMGIPTACKFKVPPISSCALLGYPVPPVGAPASGPTPDSTPGNSATPSVLGHPVPPAGAPASGPTPDSTPGNSATPSGSPLSSGSAKSASADFRTSVWTSVVAALAVTGATMAIL